jgi:uncharacterized membrane protein YoaK (UPF0700 family)
MAQTRSRVTIALSSLLGLLGGYVDTICFVRFGVFTTTVTGNIVFIGRSLLVLVTGCPRASDASVSPLCIADATAQLRYRCAVVCSHLAGVYAITLLRRRLGSATLASSVVPALSLLVLSADLIPAVCWSLKLGPLLSEVRQWVILLVAFAMGASYFISSSAGGRLNASAFDVTSHSHKAIDFLSTLQSSDCRVGLSPTARHTACQSASIAGSMCAGALLGAIALFSNPFCYDCDGDTDDSSWLLVPAAVFLFGIFRAHDGRLQQPSDRAWPPSLTEPLHAGCLGQHVDPQGIQ